MIIINWWPRDGSAAAAPRGGGRGHLDIVLGAANRPRVAAVQCRHVSARHPSHVTSLSRNEAAVTGVWTPLVTFVTLTPSLTFKSKF